MVSGFTGGSTWTGGQARPPDVASSVDRGQTLGRYVLLRRLGAGSMGVVYAAYDPDLDRKLALKILHDDREYDADMRARLVREARAIARLSHPNVVQVYDVGVDGGRVFLAMELIDGADLAGWLRAAPRSRRAIIEVLLAAGRGLAAAHAVGLVHRDFKPANVLVGADGGVRVADFGLARSRLDDEATGRPDVAGASGAATDAEDRIGTPAYMAPETHEGRPTTALSDQYSYCVTFYEALCGHRPFAGDSVEALYLAKCAARERPRGDSAAPASLLRVLWRGMTVDPSHRYAGMEELLTACVRAPGRRQLAAAGLAAAGVCAALLLISRRPSEDPALITCRHGGAAATARWQSARPRLQARFAGPAGDSWAATDAALTSFAASWSAAYLPACAAATAEPSLARAEPLRCLHRSYVEFDALLTALDAASASAADTWLIHTRLPAPTSCERERPAADLTPGDELRPDVSEVRRLLAEARQLERVGEYPRGLAVARAARARARALGRPALEAEARAREGALLAELDPRAPETLAALRDALGSALVHGIDRASADAASMLVFVDGYHHQRLAAADAWRVVAESALERLGRPTAETALMLNDWGAALMSAGEYVGAEAAYRRALALQRSSPGAEEGTVALTLHNLTNALIERGRYDEAQAAGEEALALRRRLLGDDHIAVADTLNSLGVLMLRAKRFAEAERTLQEAFHRRKRVFGPTHPRVISSLNNLGSVALEQRQFGRARSTYAYALELLERAGVTQGALVVRTLNNAGKVLLRSGRYREARTTLAKALALGSSADAGAGPDLVVTRGLLGRVSLAEDDCAGAVDQFGEARRLLARRALDERLRVDVELGDGLAAACLGREQAAAAALAAASVRPPGSAAPRSPIVEAETALLRGVLELARGAVAPAIRTLAGIVGPPNLALDPELRARVHLELAQAFRRLGGHEDEVEAHARAALAAWRSLAEPPASSLRRAGALAESSERRHGARASGRRP